MHMADALVSPAVGGAMYVLSAAALAGAVRKTGQTEDMERKLPLMAVSGAFVFAAQMINFTIPATGSSGHIGGGILLAGLLGGGPALLTIAAVLIIQCLFFADGGLLALGANIFNMGVIPCLLIYPLMLKPLLASRPSAGRLTAGTMLTSIVSLQLGAFAVVLETLLSGVTELPFGTFVLLMQPIHFAISLGEGILTAGIFNYVRKSRPEIFEDAASGKGSTGRFSMKRILLLLSVLTLLTGGCLSYYASAYPDGLEWSIAKVTGLEELEREGALYEAAGSLQEKTAFMPDYDFAAGEGTGTGAAGIVGAVMTCVLAGAAGFAVTKLCKAR